MVVLASFGKASTQPPIPLQARPARLRALPQFSAIVAWVCSAVLHRQGEPVQMLHLEDVPAPLRDRAGEEAVRALAALDPIAESAARHRARRLAGELLAKTLSDATDVELADPDYLRDCGTAMADQILERYRVQLVYGATSVPVTEVQN